MSEIQKVAVVTGAGVLAEPTMEVADVARTVPHMASLPLEANVRFATVMATAVPYIGRG